MGDKLDFMSELAKDVEAKKHGQTSTFGSINDFVPKEHQVKETEFDRTQDYEAKPAPIPAASPAESPVPVPESAPSEPVEEQPAAEGGEANAEPAGEGQKFEDLYGTNSQPDGDSGSGQGGGPASFQEEVRVKVDKPKKRASGFCSSTRWWRKTSTPGICMSGSDSFSSA